MRGEGQGTRRAKRLVDITLVMLTAPAWGMLVAVVAVLVRTRIGSPVFFWQLRPGLHGVPFRMVKFRTMTDARDSAGNPLPDSERLSRFGRFLRSTSLDELPELWNVLRGDLSLVGPRPLLIEYLQLYTPHQMRRHDVRPGMTGWAQVNGRNALSWEERFQLDVWYVNHQSLLLDLRILWRTALQVLARRGISASGEATMPKFSGNRS